MVLSLWVCGVTYDFGNYTVMSSFVETAFFAMQCSIKRMNGTGLMVWVNFLRYRGISGILDGEGSKQMSIFD